MARKRNGLGLATLVIGLSACAHRPTWNPAANELCSSSGCYRTGALAPSWRVVHQERSAIGFFNPTVGGVIQVNASCRDDADAAPLTTLTHHLLIGYTERHTLRQERVMLDGREALRTVVRAKLDGVPMALDLYVLKRNGCIFDLSFAAPPDRFDDGEHDFDRFVGGFLDERRAG